MSDARDIFTAGFSRRIEAVTSMNQRSSRGHCVVTLTTRDGTKLCCVDLAGRENDKTTKEKDDRLAELGFINLSLFHLSQVITAIRQKASIVPYRNSKLTLLLEDCIRTQRMFLLTCLSPAVSAFEDSVFSLRMAETMCSIPHQMRRRSLASPPRDSPPRPRRSSLTLPSDGPVLRSGMRIIEDDPSVARKPTTSLSTVARKTLSYRSMCSDNIIIPMVFRKLTP